MTRNVVESPPVRGWRGVVRGSFPLPGAPAWVGAAVIVGGMAALDAALTWVTR